MKHNLRCLFLVATAILSGSCQNRPFECQILSYDGNKVAQTFVFNGGKLESDTMGKWNVTVNKNIVSAEATDYSLTFTMKEGEMNSGGAAVQFEFDNWNTENYIFAPSHLYDGNRFRIYPISYPPMIYKPEDRPLSMPITVTNIPHFNQDGTDATVDFRTSNCSTPLAGFYEMQAKRGFFILTEQDTILGDQAFFISEYPTEGRLTIRLSAPGVREHQYVMCKADNPSHDRGVAMRKGDEIKMHFRVYDFPCDNLMAYFDKFLTIRKDLSGQNEYRNLEPFSSIAHTISKHVFAAKWFEDDKFGYTCHGPQYAGIYYHLQIGWNGVPVYTLMQLARPEAQPDYDETLRRVSRSLDAMRYMQRESGLFSAIMKDGEYFGDTYRESAITRDVVLVTRLGLALYYGLQCLDMLKIQGYDDLIKPEWEDMFRKEADALVALFERYGHFGQLVHSITGEIYTPNSSAGSSSISALAYASKYFGDTKYMETALKAGEWYYANQTMKGYAGGSAAEVLQSPESESAAEITEAYTVLFELTRDEKWLKRACDAAGIMSSWVVSYDYKFPDGTNFANAGVKATGSVWASVQNEHSAPGLYVMSGDYLLKLFRSTDDWRYLELCKDMAHNVIQYVNTQANHVQPGDSVGWCTERVNISDWEGQESVGNVIHDSNCAWENVNLYHITENPGIYVQADKREIMVIDHVNAKIVRSDADSVTLEIENPTYRDGDVSVLVETSDYAHENPLGWNAFYSWPKVHVPSGETVTVTLPVAK
ncbi:MAG: hypothetical protein Q4E55_04095 [Bacteroidales bacterium]|nr:hypothetical protein [Bacteroidales bacterium]